MTAPEAGVQVLPAGRAPGDTVREVRRPGEPFDRFALAGWEDEFPGLVAGVTAAAGGADFGFTTAPSAWEHVGRVRGLARQLGFPRIAMVRQEHGCAVRHVPGGAWEGLLVAGDADGLVVDREGVLACVTAADCVPVYLLDPVRGRGALLHAGWRGAAAGILEAGVQALKGRDGDPSTWRMHLGPAICGGCYEVGYEVLRAFGLPGDEGSHVDLRHLLARRAVAAGVPAGRVSRSAWCTRCSLDQFHSHRGKGAGAGRMAAYLGWKEVGSVRRRPGG